MTIEVTKEQFMSYRKVQKDGKYNMLDPQAIKATGLSEDVYMNIIQNSFELCTCC